MPALLRNARMFPLLLLACMLPACHSPAASTTGSNDVSEAHQQAMYFTTSGNMYAHPDLTSPRREPQYDKGMAYLRAALIIEPDYHPASFCLADALIKTGKVDEGLAILQAVAKNNDEYGRYAQKRLAKMQSGAAK